MQKIKTIPQIVNISKKLRSKNRTIGLITGCFDIVHIDHIHFFRFVKKHLDFLGISYYLNNPIIKKVEKTLDE